MTREGEKMTNVDRRAAAKHATRLAGDCINQAIGLLGRAARITGDDEFNRVTYDLDRARQRAEAAAERIPSD